MMLETPGAAAFISTNTVQENKAEAFDESGAPGAPCSPMEEPSLEAQPGQKHRDAVRVFLVLPTPSSSSFWGGLLCRDVLDKPEELRERWQSGHSGAIESKKGDWGGAKALLRSGAP